LRLLLREFDDYKGSILFGGIAIDSYKMQRLRQAIGYVPQDHFLFSTSIPGTLHSRSQMPVSGKFRKLHHWPIFMKTSRTLRKAMKQWWES
ncbi:hypothetical protein NL349_27350, partial [Klebsiella pneumoniae]|nr:hypothetical protein [Klebsiella pneumoniae]